MNFKILSDEQLVANTKNLVRVERETLTEILHHFREIEHRRVYARFGYSNLHEFATKHLGYSDAAAQRRISSMRLMREIPEIETKIQEGVLSLSNISRAQGLFRAEAKLERTFTRQEKIEILKSIESKSAREAEKELLKISPLAVPQEKVRQVTEDLTELKIVLDSKLMGKLQRLKELLSHKNPGMAQKEVIENALDIALNKLDPDRRSSKATPTSEWRSSNSRYVSAKVKHQVWTRDMGQCQFKSEDGKICGSRYLIEYHHTKPLAFGGQTTVENLKLFCKSHNSYQAIQDLGWEKMASFLNAEG